MSIAVLRTFIEVRKKEHIEEYEKKRNKRLQKLQATGVSSVSLEGKIENGIDKFTQNDKTHHLSADTNATLSTENEENPQEITGDAQGPETSELLQSTALADLKPLRVLEVHFFGILTAFLSTFYFFSFHMKNLTPIFSTF